MIPNCFCNICSVPIYREHRTLNTNFCSAACREIDRRPNPQEKMSLNYSPRAKSPVGILMEPWPSPKVVRQSYHPSRSLRIHGIASKRLTTKHTRLDNP